MNESINIKNDEFIKPEEPVTVVPKNQQKKVPFSFIKVVVTVYALTALFIIFGNNTLVVGDFVRVLSLPMFLLGVVLGLSVLGYGISQAGDKANPSVTRILFPIVGLVVGAILFFGGAFLALIASMSNVSEGGT